MKKYPAFVFALICSTIWISYQSVIWTKNFYREILPDVTVLKNRYPVFVKKDELETTFKLLKQRPAHWRSLGEVSRKAISAILISEDGGFFQHHGYEPEAIRAAWEHNLKPGVKIKRGGSTITQQVVKNLFLTREKTLTRKIRELLLAVELERQFTKGKILEIYLNIAEWGPGVYGIDQASRKYFHKSPAELTAREGAVLAFMLPNPNRYRFSFREGALTNFGSSRVETILERMWRAGHISDEEYASSELEDKLSSSL